MDRDLRSRHQVEPVSRSAFSEKTPVGAGVFLLPSLPRLTYARTGMSPILAKILLLGIPLVLSLAWFAFWMVKLLRTARKVKRDASHSPGPGPSSPSS